MQEFNILEEKLPDYYKLVLANVKGKDKLVELWRANNGDEDLYTVYLSNKIIEIDTIISWVYSSKNTTT